MGLFGLGKKKDNKEQTDSVPTPSSQNKIPDVREIKKAISEPKQSQSPPLQPLQYNQNKSSQSFQLLQPVSIKPRTMESTPESPIEPERAPSRLRIRDISEPMGNAVSAKSKEPIYIKIDKFESAQEDFEDIKQRLHDSFELLDKIKSVRGREEEEELEVWEREVENIKRRLLDIDRNLFSKVDY